MQNRLVCLTTVFLLVVNCTGTSTQDLLDTTSIPSVKVIPATAVVDVDQKQVFKVAGKKPFTANVSFGSGAITQTGDAEFTFTAPSVAQASVISFTSANGGKESVTVTITQPAILPNSLSGLVFWLKADSITGVSNGTQITAWNDSSGNGKTFSTANGPTMVSNCLNGKPCLQFNGTNQYLQQAGVYDVSLNTTAFTFLVIVRTMSMGTSGEIYRSLVGAGVDGFGLAIADNGFGSGTHRALIGNATLQWDYLWPLDRTINVNAWDLYSLHLDTTLTRMMHRNGFMQAAMYNSYEVNGSVKPTIGSLETLNGSWFNGQISEIILYNVALSDYQRRGVNCYLKNKYRLDAVTCS